MHVDESRLSTDLREMLSLSIDAGVEIERSVADKSSRKQVIHRLGRVLAKNSSRQFQNGRRGFSDPSYVSPMSSVYAAQNKDDTNPSLDKVVDYWATKAREFQSFDEDWSPQQKHELVEICVQLHQYLAEALSDRGKERLFGRLH